MTAVDKAATRPRRKPRRRYVLEDQVGFILRQASQRHAVIFAELMGDDLTPTQFTALVKLNAEGSVSQNRLGRLAAMDAATIKGVIDRLYARGLVEGAADPKDARRRVLTLTPKGQELVERVLPIAAEITARTLEPLDDDEQARFLALLRRLS